MREELELLWPEEVTEIEQEERWDRIQRLAPGLIVSGRHLIAGVTSLEIQARLGI